MQAQMTPATAPGIAGLMRGMPQGKPPTQPQGLNAIDPRTMQALGLREALRKAEMEAASLRQQAMNQQTPQMSVAEQNLQKLAALEAEKMAPQSAQNQAPIVAGASQQQASARDGKINELLAMVSQGGPQGITRAPGADQVMPQRMAGGGIVAFQEGGEAPFPGYQNPDVDENGNPRSQSDRARIIEINKRRSDALARQKLPSLAGFRQIRREMPAEAIERLREFPPTGPRGGPGFVREGDRAVLETLAQAEEPPVQPDTMQAEEQRLLGRFPAPQAAPSTPQAAPPMRMPPAQVRSKVPVQGVPAALEKPVLPPESPQGGIPQSVQPPTSQSSMQDMLKQMKEYRQGEFAEMSKLAKELYALPPEVRQIYEQRIAQAKQAAQPAPQDFAGRFAKLGMYGPAKGIASAYGQMMGDERAQQEKLRSGVKAAEDALIQAQEAARLKSAETALGARGKAGETFGTLAGVDVSRQGVEAQREGIAERAETARLNREVQKEIAKMDDATRRFLKNTTEMQQMAELYEKNPEVFKARYGDREELLYAQLRKSYDDYIVKLPLTATPITFKQYVAQFKEASKKGPEKGPDLGTRENPIKLD